MAQTSGEDQILSFDQMRQLVRAHGEDGLRDVLRRFGTLAGRLTMLGIELENRQSGPIVKNYPPAVFIAYKWADDEHQAWVRSLAAELRSRGYDVLLDQDHLAQDASDFSEVPAYIARLVGSDVCLVVVTEAYLDLVEARRGKTSWVYDEFAAAVELANHGRLQICALWKDPNVSPSGIALRANVIDARQVPFDAAVLDEDLPAYAGPVLDPASRDRLVDFALRADEMLSEPEPPLERIRDWLVEHGDLDPLYDFQLRLSRLYWLAGMLPDAYTTALPLLDDCRDADQALHLAQVLDAAGAHPAMFRFLHRARQRRWLTESASLHYFLGETLFELGSNVAARNHFGWLLASPDFSALPGHLKTQIRDRHDQLGTGQTVSGNAFACDTCRSRYHLDGGLRKVCGECATLYGMQDERCPVCTNDGIVPLEILAVDGLPAGVHIGCPICDRGAMRVDRR